MSAAKLDNYPIFRMVSGGLPLNHFCLLDPTNKQIRSMFQCDKSQPAPNIKNTWTVLSITKSWTFTTSDVYCCFSRFVQFPSGSKCHFYVKICAMVAIFHCKYQCSLAEKETTVGESFIFYIFVDNLVSCWWQYSSAFALIVQKFIKMSVPRDLWTMTQSWACYIFFGLSYCSHYYNPGTGSFVRFSWIFPDSFHKSLSILL